MQAMVLVRSELKQLKRLFLSLYETIRKQAIIHGYTLKTGKPMHKTSVPISRVNAPTNCRAAVRSPLHVLCNLLVLSKFCPELRPRFVLVEQWEAKKPYRGSIVIIR